MAFTTGAGYILCSEPRPGAAHGVNGLKADALRENRIIVGAFGVSVLLHLVLALVTWRIPFVPQVDPALADDRYHEVEVLLAEPEQGADAAADEPDLPTAITSIPDRLASDTPPVRADFLAEHDAIAADRSGGDSDKPRADEQGPFPQVDILQDQLDGAGGVAFSQAPLPDAREATGSPAEGQEGEDDQRSEAELLKGESGDWALPREQSEAGGESKGEADDQQTDLQKQPDLEKWWGGQAPSMLKEGQQSSAGDRGFEFDQKSMGDLGAGVAIDGDFSLNTYEWDYAPWMQAFRQRPAPALDRALRLPAGRHQRHDRASAWSCEKDGRLQRMEILETDGHESLHDASRGGAAGLRALRTAAAELSRGESCDHPRACTILRGGGDAPQRRACRAWSRPLFRWCRSEVCDATCGK